MFWLGMFIGAIIGGTITLFLHCMLILAKESDYHSGRE